MKTKAEREPLIRGWCGAEGRIFIVFLLFPPKSSGGRSGSRKWCRITRGASLAWYRSRGGVGAERFAMTGTFHYVRDPICRADDTWRCSHKIFRQHLAFVCRMAGHLWVEKWWKIDIFCRKTNEIKTSSIHFDDNFTNTFFTCCFQ